MLFPLLAYLQLGNGSMVVLQWFLNLVTAGCVINYIVICITYIFFYRACKAQGVDRKDFPYVGWMQPCGAVLGLCFTTFVLLFYGYSSFTPWDVGTFFSYYAMAMIAAVTFSGWKILKRTRVVPAADADLVWERPAIDAYEQVCEDIPKGFWQELLDMTGWRRAGRATGAV